MVRTVSDRHTEPGAAKAMSLPLALSMALLAGLAVALTGCAGTVGRHTSVSGFPDALDAEAIASQSTDKTIEGRPVSATRATDIAVTDFPPCPGGSSRHRVRDLRVPWAQRRYLVADGTICSPNAVDSL